MKSGGGVCTAPHSTLLCGVVSPPRRALCGAQGYICSIVGCVCCMPLACVKCVTQCLTLLVCVATASHSERQRVWVVVVCLLSHVWHRVLCYNKTVYVQACEQLLAAT